jgi:hypothetical protein
VKIILLLPIPVPVDWMSYSLERIRVFVCAVVLLKSYLHSRQTPNINKYVQLSEDLKPEINTY